MSATSAMTIVATSPPTLTERLFEQRILVLGEAVDDEIANRLVAQLLLLSADDPHSDICLHINSPGGSVTAGLAIYDTMQLIPNDVATVAFGSKSPAICSIVNWSNGMSSFSARITQSRYGHIDRGRSFS